MKEIIVWRRFDNKIKKFIHNHIEDGHINNSKPIGKFKHQTVSWSSGKWEREEAYLDKGNNIVKGEK